MELNQKLTKARREDARYGAFTRRKNTYVKTMGLKRGKGIHLKGAYFRKLMVILRNLTYAVGMGD